MIYAGEAHAQVRPGAWSLGEAPHKVVLVKDDHPGAFAFRKGFFLGDGTGCGKGREIAGVIADNIAQGRQRAVWGAANCLPCEVARVLAAVTQQAGAPFEPTELARHLRHLEYPL